MTTLQLLIVCTTVLAALLTAHQLIRGEMVTRLAIARVEAAARIRIPSETMAPRRIGHRVTVHTKKPDERTLFGVVAGDYVDRLVLEDAEYVTRDGAHPLPGRQDIATSEIAWIDVHQLVAPVPDSAPAAERAPGDPGRVSH